MIHHNTITYVRNKWKIIPGYNPCLIRQDQCWAFIKFSDYGNRKSKYWWEIDHIWPASLWWTDALSNLRPLQRENNLAKSNWILTCPVRAKDFYVRY